LSGGAFARRLGPAMESALQWSSHTKVEFLKKLPSQDRLAEALGFRPEKVLVIYDKRLLKGDAQVKKWLGDFALTYPVTAGEGLKDLTDFPSHIKKILRLVNGFSVRSLAVVALGGGSVGDFAGFISSVVKRGLPLVHIPTTLLAAMDSAHGGKTALNVGDYKNQVGTFYPAQAVLLVKSLFEGLPRLQLQSASGELAKMALLTGGELFENFKADFKPELDRIWELLPSVITAKYSWVEKDPFERSGERQVLNLGHTLGHALESYHKVAHGVAVGEGLLFALRWSEHQGYLRTGDALADLVRERVGLLDAKAFSKHYRLMSRSRLARFIAEDKKMTDARHLHFVFLEGVGKPFRKVVPFESFLTETQRQGWTAL